MYEVLADNPWLIVIALGVLVPLSAIIFGTLTSYWQQVRVAEIEASLKHAMLERGMSAEEIKTVLEASATRVAKRKCRMHEPPSEADKVTS